MAEYPSLSGAILDVNSVCQYLDEVTDPQKIEEVVIEAGTLVAEGKIPMEDATLLVCHAQIRVLSLQNGDGKIAS